MSEKQLPVALLATDVLLSTKPSVYPEPYASLMKGREKRRLGEAFGLANFGVNLTTLAPGGVSALRHAHSKQDEFVYILIGSPKLVTDAGSTRLDPGMCAGFRAGLEMLIISRTTPAIRSSTSRLATGRLAIRPLIQTTTSN